jgi:hypothetical protein
LGETLRDEDSGCPPVEVVVEGGAVVICRIGIGGLRWRCSTSFEVAHQGWGKNQFNEFDVDTVIQLDHRYDVAGRDNNDWKRCYFDNHWRTGFGISIGEQSRTVV